ncbi:hypothetical protein PH210_25915 [Paenibacillus sp. BSR1-1]|uniref:TerC family protein n=1 Tax=Paenibacillus sp. BSR1-1 TaxID=3020845 RepID=UPI0025B1BB29|nr:hypothetical protein [Paenibacillus sp. BSR1-1]MDN3019606.1 hypothetical protein [Paenibacillus sp. BSR1-1]
MEVSLFLEYGWIFIILIVLEGLLSTDNALVLAIMARHLPVKQQRKAINLGLTFAFIFRIAAIFIISSLFGLWQIQAVGAAYLIFIALKHLLKSDHEEKVHKRKSYLVTVAQIAFADIAFAVDSILAAVALVIDLPDTPLGEIGGMDGAQFIVIVLGAIAGLLAIRFAAGFFVKVLAKRPSLEKAAMVLVGWVGIKLFIHTLAHPSVHMIPLGFIEGSLWNTAFWSVLILIALGGWILTKDK